MAANARLFKKETLSILSLFPSFFSPAIRSSDASPEVRHSLFRTPCPPSAVGADRFLFHKMAIANSFFSIRHLDSHVKHLLRMMFLDRNTNPVPLSSPIAPQKNGYLKKAVPSSVFYLFRKSSEQWLHSCLIVSLDHRIETIRQAIPDFLLF